MSLVTIDKKKTDRSQVSSASTAYNAAKVSRKSPSSPFLQDGSIQLSGSNLSGNTSAAKSPRGGRTIQPSTINKLPSQTPSQSQSPASQSQPLSQPQLQSQPQPQPQPQQQQQQSSTSDKQPSNLNRGQSEAPAPASPGAGGGIGAEATTGALRPDLGMKIEFCLGLLASAILLSLWIFLMTTDCYEKPDAVFWIKTFAVLGIVAGLVISIFCCFERSIGPSRGFASCLYVVFIAMVGGLNLIGAYLANTCICTCRENAIKSSKKDDLVIFILELLGAICILGVILVASLTRPMV